MEYRATFLYMVIVVTGFSLRPAARSRAAAPDELLARIKTYKLGQNRDDLAAIEGMVAASMTNPQDSQQLAERLAGLLGTQATYECKQFVCRQLALIAAEEQVPELTGLLSDEQLSHMALYAMVPISGPAVDEALRNALDHASGRTRVGIINALGCRRDEQAMDKLARLLMENEPEAAAAAAHAMAKIDGAKAAGFLNKALSQTKTDLRPVLADAYLACADNLLQSGDREAAGKIYEQMCSAKQTPPIRAAALRGLAVSKGQNAIELVIRSLSDNDPQIRRMAARLAREIPGEGHTGLLAEQLSRLPAPGQVMLLSALADRGDTKALPAIENACGSAEETVRVEALRTLGALGEASVVMLLAERAAKGSEAEQEVARRSLTRLQGDGVDAKIVEQLSKTDAPVRVELLKCLSERGVKETTKTLLETARDMDRDVRLTSLRVLRDAAVCRDLPALVELLVGADADTRQEAEKTVVAVAKRCSDETQQTSALLEKLNTTADSQVRSSLLAAIGKIGGRTALNVLKGALHDKDAQVRTAAIRALSEWPTDEPLRDLLQIVQSTNDRLEQSLALRGYIRLIGENNCRQTTEAFEMYRNAMGFASTAAEKKLVLSGLATVRTAATLQFAAGFLEDEALREEAEVTVLQIARVTCGAYRDKTRELLEKIIRDTKSETTRTQGQAITEMIGKFGDYVTAWEVSPAYVKDNAGCTELFDIAFAPEVPDGARVCWQLMPAGTNQQQPWLMDLLEVLGGDNRVAYLRNIISSDQARTLTLELGSDDGIKVWLNGKVVHSVNTMRAIAPAQERVNVALTKGRNTLLLKVTQNVMGWGACVRFTTVDGSKVDGLRFSVE